MQPVSGPAAEMVFLVEREASSECVATGWTRTSRQIGRPPRQRIVTLSLRAHSVIWDSELSGTPHLGLTDVKSYTHSERGAYDSIRARYDVHNDING